MVIAEPAAALGSALRLHVATSHFPVADIVQTRVLLETWAAARARAGFPCPQAGRRTPRTDGNAALDPEAFMELDVSFHLALAEADWPKTLL